jgi:FkbM family methyltransferase
MLKEMIKSIMPLAMANYKEQLYFEKYGEPEVHLVRHLCDRKRDAIDIGANYGEYIHFMRHYAQRTFGYEPIPALYHELLRKFRRNPVILSPIAVSDTAGKATLRIPIKEGSPVFGCSTVSDTESAEYLNCTSMEVLTMPLDAMSEIGDAAFIKIDVEGHEQAVLRGAKKTILRCQPRILVEIDENLSPGGIAKVIEFLSPMRYEGFFVHRWKLLPIRQFTPDLQDPANRADISVPLKQRAAMPDYVSNFIFLPIWDGPSRVGALHRELANQEQRRLP